MANELQAFLPTGKTLYAVLLNSIGQVWDGTQFETIAAETWTDNGIPLIETTAGLYLASMPSVGAGSYSYVVYEQAGANPAVTDTLFGMGNIDWDGETPVSLETLNEQLDAIKVLIDAIKLKTDGLDISDVTFVTAVVGSDITILRGDTLDDGSLTDLGDLTDYVSIDFTVKNGYSKTDDEAIIRIRKNASGVGDGLLRFNGAVASSAALGSIVIDDLLTGDITIMLDEAATKDLLTGDYIYDLQVIKANSVKTKTYGKLYVVADITRAVS